MKIQDTIGRQVDIALVTKPAANALFGADVDWIRPVFHTVANSKKLFVRMPLGAYALRVMSKHATEMLVHVSGKLVLSTKVNPGLQYLRHDGKGNLFVFGEDNSANDIVNISSDAEKIAALSATAAGADDDTASADADAIQPSLSLESNDGADQSAEDFVQLPLMADADENSVFVVVRFVDEPGPGLKPPAQEFEVDFQMNKPADHDELLATSNLLTMVKPSLLINEQDEVSFEPPQTHRPTFTCTCTGCVRGSN